MSNDHHQHCQHNGKENNHDQGDVWREHIKSFQIYLFSLAKRNKYIIRRELVANFTIGSPGEGEEKSALRSLPTAIP
jgi:hypothetical protein